MKVSYNELENVFEKVLIRHAVPSEKARLCARIFAENSRDGVHSHGLNRFPVFVKQVNEGFIDVFAEPECVSGSGALEQWDGHFAPGMYTATKAMERAIELATFHHIGIVAVRNTNHWMRGGTYGWQAADQGVIGICMTNTIANMPPWGGKEPRLGNNPLVISIPRKEGHIVLDMAMSQYSYGKLQEYELNERQLPFAGGYDASGKLSSDPHLIRETKRVLPVGFWKGSGLSWVIDILCTLLSDGRSTAQITQSGTEYGLSQIFIAIDPLHMDQGKLDDIIAFTKSSALAENEDTITFPGENTLKNRKRSIEEGVYVNEKIWQQVISL